MRLLTTLFPAGLIAGMVADAFADASWRNLSLTAAV